MKSQQTFVTNQQLKSALGTFQSPAQKAYYQKMCLLFRPMNIPEPGDWLHGHPQKHQSFSDYKLPNYNQVTPQRKTIYLQQFGMFSKSFMLKLSKFCQAFYPKMLVKSLPVLSFQKQLPNIKKRKNYYGNQYLAQDILAYMEKRVPKDAYCVMGITLNDIYPGENWNFVYGWAKYKARVGIFSFLRWDDEFATWKGENQGKQSGKEKKEIDWELILYPSIRTMVHEIGHMFAVTHCVYHRCLMNGYNNIQQNYLNPLEFCPICFRKIVKNIGFDKQLRYKNLIKYCEESDLKQLKIDKKLYQQLLLISKSVQDKISLDPKVTLIHNHSKQRKKGPIQSTNNGRVDNKNRGRSLQVGVRR